MEAQEGRSPEPEPKDRSATASSPAWLIAAAVMSAATFTVYGFLLRTLPDLEPPSDRGSIPAIETGFQVLFVVLGLLLAGLFAVRYLLIARDVTRGETLQPRQRRRLRKDRATAIWAVVVLTTFCAVAAGPRPGALPLTGASLVAASAWAVAAIAAVRAERANATDPGHRRT